MDVHYLSQVHQISNLILIIVTIFTVVFQDEVLAKKSQHFKDVFRATDTRDLKDFRVIAEHSAQQ